MPEITKKYFEDRIDGVETTIREGIREVVSHFSQSQAEQDKRIVGRFTKVDQRFDAVDQRFDAVDQRFDAVDQRFDAVDQRFAEVDAKLDAIMEMLTTRKELHNLVRALKNQGIKLEETEIFVA